MNAWFLVQESGMSWPSVGLSLAVVAGYTCLVLFNPWLAWASFRKDKEAMPEWIRRKVKQLTPDQRNELRWVEQLGSKLTGEGAAAQ